MPKRKTAVYSTHGAGSLGNQKERKYPDRTQVPTHKPKPAKGGKTKMGKNYMGKS